MHDMDAPVTQNDYGSVATATDTRSTHINVAQDNAMSRPTAAEESTETSNAETSSAAAVPSLAFAHSKFLSALPAPACIKQKVSSIECLREPMVRRNFRLILLALLLLLLGGVSLIAGVLAQLGFYGEKAESSVFFIAAGLCLIPGVYHTVYLLLGIYTCCGIKLNDVPILSYQ